MGATACSFLPAEIEEVLLKSGQDKAPGLSNLTIRLLCIAKIAYRLAKLFYKILETPIAPPDRTKANMIFIPKRDTPYSPTMKSLRPIKLLETIQKVFLKVVYSRITKVFVKHRILKGTKTSVPP
jgi:hypothetical protein